jgi:hypothetical protein
VPLPVNGCFARLRVGTATSILELLGVPVTVLAVNVEACSVHTTDDRVVSLR